MREWSKPISTLLVGFAVWLFCLFIYLSHTPLNYTYDGMVFASRIERDTTPLWDIFHPHHLIYAFLGRLVYLWGKAHGATWDGLVALQFFDLVTGSLGVLIAYHLLFRETKDRLVSGVSALGMAFTFSYWYFSTSPGVRIFATVTPLFAWYVFTYLKKSRPLFGLWLGLAHALAVLGHQTNILLLPAFLGGIWLLGEKSLWDKLKTSFYYLVALAAGVLGVYGFVGRFVCYRLNYSSWIWWIFSYFHVQQWGGNSRSTGLSEGSYAMVKAFLHETPPHQAMVDSFTFMGAQVLFVYTLWVLLAVLVLRSRHLWKQQKQTLWIGFMWLLAFVPFFLWWEPWNIEFWVSSTAPCWILMGIVVSDLSQVLTQPILYLANRVLIVTTWAGMIVLLFLYNFNGVVQTLANPVSYEKAQSIHGHQELLDILDIKVRPRDLLILTGINTIPFYIDRYKKRDYLNLHLFLKKYLMTEIDDKKKGLDDESAPIPTLDPWGDLTRMIQDRWAHHHRVWVLAEAVDEKDDWRIKFETMMGLPPGQLTAFFRSFQLKSVPYHGKVYFYQVLPNPTVPLEPTPTFAFPTTDHVVGIHP